MKVPYFQDRMYRYVCPKCLRTFLDEKYSEEWICWKCGQGIVVIPKEIKIKDLEKELSLQR